MGEDKVGGRGDLHRAFLLYGLNYFEVARVIPTPSASACFGAIRQGNSRWKWVRLAKDGKRIP